MAALGISFKMCDKGEVLDSCSVHAKLVNNCNAQRPVKWLRLTRSIGVVSKLATDCIS